MASLKPFFLSNLFFFVKFMAFTFAADTTTTKANTNYINPLERTATITEIKNEKASRTFWKTLDTAEDEPHLVTEYAGLHYKYRSFSKVQAMVGVWQPAVAKSDGQNSFAQVKLYVEDLSNGILNQTLEAGWIVNVTDEKPRFYVYSVNNQFSQGCLNLECGAFKLAEGASTTLNGILKPVSTYNSIYQWGINVTINHEVRDNIKVWAVYLQGSLVGYYPQSIFGETGVMQSVDFGGGVTVMSNGPQSPHSGTEMGSGHFPYEGFRKAAYISHMQLYGDVNGPLPEDQISITPYFTNKYCYSVNFVQGNGGPTDPIWGTHIYYGGPGGKDNGCTNNM